MILVTKAWSRGWKLRVDAALWRSTREGVRALASMAASGRGRRITYPRVHMAVRPLRRRMHRLAYLTSRPTAKSPPDTLVAALDALRDARRPHGGFRGGEPDDARRSRWVLARPRAPADHALLATSGLALGARRWNPPRVRSSNVS